MRFTHRSAGARLASVAAAAALALSAAVAAPAGAAPPAQEPDGPRTIITTDPELDDLNSMLRLMLYSNEIDIEGLVYSSSVHHYSGNEENGIAAKRWPQPDRVFHIDSAVNAYEEAYPNLVKHDSNYPTPGHLRSLIAWGNVENVGDMAEDTDGSDLVRDVLLDDEPGKVFLQAWGGPNTIARALKSIEEEYKGTPEWAAVYSKIINKAVITSWGQQDTTFADYIKPTWPQIENREVSTSIWGYGTRGVIDEADAKYVSAEWTHDNVSTVGPIGAEYRVWGDGKQMAAGFDDEDYFGLSGLTADELKELGYKVWTPPQPKGSFISEGDSSNFALLVENGLRSWENPGWGGWGGRQALKPDDPYSWANRGVKDADQTGVPRNDWAAARWVSDFQNDFAARLQWSVQDTYEAANHHPVVSIREGIDITAPVGGTVSLTADASDPDGDELHYAWWQYREAGTSPAVLDLKASGGAVTFAIPDDALPKDTLHVILEVSDDGSPTLTSYKRVVVTVTDAKEPPASPEPTVEPTAEPTGAPAAEPSQQPSAAPTKPGDLYETPGFHKVNGRHWMTVCEPYSATSRCWTYIWATQIQRSGSQYFQVNGWAFNNLTYVAAPKAIWSGNPLATAGTWTAADGRHWMTECNTAATGGNGCRSYAEAKVVERTKNGYRTVNKLVFNNIVRFK